ncbi:hypothetical protein [Bacillus thermotolerans]|uniref:hypothetical protein n=1 Tax=Bacillus thermotolerans TaxID=1221996 RepID=UPI0005830176|nr:hypothetical protein [Bacillus thermotolerans]KKB36505.1 hypothetical protein QY97_00904 [Bacillus thermotolerans]KKB36506.1 hypothetical protein QY97_00905 [Bacillus thermotolerans]KKB44908.1 hypothetical protein QY96_00032 [Bacillus thermotolerans]KKB44909.1 hypothetical protein QY96_00033 [Bacillus thermotolerans]
MTGWRSGAVCRTARRTYDLEPQGGKARQKRKVEAPDLLRPANVLNQRSRSLASLIEVI